MMLGMVADWLKKHWRKGDFQVVPLVQNATGGANTPATMRPIEERIKELAQQAAKKRRKPPQVRRSDGSLRRPKG